MHSYDYAIVRVVPRVERGEFINAGVLLCTRDGTYLDVAMALDEARLRALDPQSTWHWCTASWPASGASWPGMRMPARSPGCRRGRASTG